MIEINLLPEGLRKRQAFRFNLPKKYLQNAAFLVIGSLVCVHILIQTFIFIAGLMLANAEKRMASIQPQRRIADALEAQVQKYRSLEDLFGRESRTPLRSAPVLNFIARELPEGIWLSELSLFNGGAELKGSCFSADAREMSRIGEFLNALKQDARRQAVFSKLELSSVQRKKLGPTEIVEFIIRSGSKKQTPEAKKK
jgi:Tfp pilus assembly protein PilN